MEINVKQCTRQYSNEEMANLSCTTDGIIGENEGNVAACDECKVVAHIDCMKTRAKNRQICTCCIHMYQSKICCKKDTCYGYTSLTMVPPELLCEDCGNTLHVVCSTKILIDNHKEYK